ncbi:LarC family nickel insertion protein, partial [bacterium]|nr:LarC family nickel insertion protein [bacterium]
TPINVGSGTVKISHGIVSVPAPATALIVKGIPIICDGLPGERTTPTGAALAAEFVDSFENPGKFTINQIGYGAGKLDSGDRANVLRLLVCSQDSSDAGSNITEQLIMIETDIDDDSPEIIGYLLERLNVKPGVLDVSLVQTLRKKNRPGFLLRILAVPAIAEAVRRIVFQETSTLGVREATVLRHSVDREVLNSVTPWGSIRVIRAGNTLSPEFEDCRKAAETHEIPLRDVYRGAIEGLNKTS